MRIFRFIAAKRAEHSIQTMCRVLEVSRSGFHAWAAREPSARALADAALSARIAEIHAESGDTYGSPRVHAELRLEDGVRVARKRVERLMRRAGLFRHGPAPARPHDRLCSRHPDRPGPRRARLQLERDQPLVVRGHHVHPDVGGLAVPGVGDGLLQPANRRMGARRAPARRARDRRARDGRRAPAAGLGPRASQRSRLAVHVAGVHPSLPFPSASTCRWEAAAIASTTPSSRASTRASRRTSSSASRGRPRPKPAARSSTTSRSSTTAGAVTRRSGCSRPWSSRTELSGRPVPVSPLRGSCPSR